MRMLISRTKVVEALAAKRKGLLRNEIAASADTSKCPSHYESFYSRSLDQDQVGSCYITLDISDFDYQIII